MNTLAENKKFNLPGSFTYKMKGISKRLFCSEENIKKADNQIFTLSSLHLSLMSASIGLAIFRKTFKFMCFTAGNRQPVFLFFRKKK